jgi:hypothetical protein
MSAGSGIVRSTTLTQNSTRISSLVLPVLEFLTSPYSVGLNAIALVRKVYALAGLESSGCEQKALC